MTSMSYRGINLSSLAALLQRYGEEKSSKKNQLNVPELLPFQIYQKAENIEKRVRDSDKKCPRHFRVERKQNWILGEQKLFCSILPYFCHLYALKIYSLNISEAFPLTEIFLTKTPDAIFFEIKHILSLNSSVKTIWSESCEEALAALLNSSQFAELKEGNMKWKSVAFELFRINAFSLYHSARECRQKWINHLDPAVSKQAWSVSEDLEIVLLTIRLGCKWALLSKILEGKRTEHMIKNRINSLVRKFIRRPSKKIKDTHLQIIAAALREKVEVEAEENPKVKQQNQKTTNMDESSQASQAGSAEMAEYSEREILSFTDLMEIKNTPIQRYILIEEKDWQFEENDGSTQMRMFEVFNQNLLLNLQIFTSFEAI